MSDIVLNEVKRSDSNCSRVSSTGSNVSSEPSSPGEAFKDLKLRKTGGEILLSRYLKVSYSLLSIT